MTSSENQPVNALPPELAQLEAEAAALTPPVADPNTPAGELPAVVDYMGDAEMITGMVFEGVGALYPSTPPILTPKQQRFAAALAKVMEKHSWSMAGILGKWGAEIELAFVGASLAIPLAKAIRADRAADKAAADQAERIAKNPDPQPARPASDPYNAAFAAE